MALAQHVLLHLAHGVARQLGREDHPLRQLEAGEHGLEAADDGPLLERGAGLRHHDGRDTLAEIGMRHADDRGF